jgi:hypothetical protein
VREIKALLPTTEKYDPEQFIDLKKAFLLASMKTETRNIFRSVTGKNNMRMSLVRRVQVKA